MKKNKLKKKEVKEELLDEIQFETEEDKNYEQFYRGVHQLKDFIAPSSFNRENPDYIKVGEKFVKSFNLKGFPREVYVGWLDEFYSYDGVLDLQLFIEPTDDRTAMEELTHKITQFEAQLAIEREKGSIRNLTMLESKIQELYQERILLEKNAQKLYQGSISVNLYADSEKELKSRHQKLDHRLKGRKIILEPNTLRQDDGYKSATPYGKNYVLDTYRNMNSGAITACFPFYQAEMMHPGGVYMGRNLSTGNPIFIDLFDRDWVNNSNGTIFGDSGSGKTVFTSAFVLRSALRGVRATIIDPEGEYNRLVEEMGGVTIKISPSSKSFINVFEIEEEEEVDEDGYLTGNTVCRVVDKVADILNLISIMVGHLDDDMRSYVAYTVQELYAERGINEDPNSLYIEDTIFNEETGYFHYANIKKKMPTFSDFHDKLEEKAKTLNNERLDRLVEGLRIFRKGGVYGMFDCETSENLQHYRNATVINFDISDLEENVLRPIGMYVALSFTWEKFGKKNKEQKKYIIVDEAWMLTKDDYSAGFMENLSRRARKRGTGFIVASQKFNEFAANDKGRAVLTNSSINVFLKTKTEDCDGVQEMFKLSDGERHFILQASKGEALIKTAKESAIMQTHVLEYEEDIFFRRKKIKSTEGE